jgi:molybdopterin converting factor small subunit
MERSMTIDVTIPRLLSDAIGEHVIAIDADTLAAAVDRLRAHAKLGPLIFDDAGRLRPHVLIFHNDQATRWLDSLDVPIRAGDTISVVQATSGG